MKGILQLFGQYQDGNSYGIIACGNDTYLFSQQGMLDRGKDLRELTIGSELEFDPFTSSQGKLRAARVRPAGEEKPRFAVAHSQGEFRDFVSINTKRVFRALERAMGEAPFPSLEATYRALAVHYNTLSDADFRFAQGTVTFPSGCTAADSMPILLLLSPSEPGSRVPWYCESILAGDVRYDGDTVFDLIHANWYDLEADLAALLPELARSATEIVADIEARTIDPGSLIALAEGRACALEAADALYAPTGYFAENGEEIYLLAEKRNGVRGYGWYYQHPTYVGAPLSLYDKKSWLTRWGGPIEWSIYEQLANQTLEESWSFAGRADYGILRNYLSYTFSHQWEEGQIALSADGVYAAFNTGLPDRNTYKYLYAFYERKAPRAEGLHPLYAAPEYALRGFVVQGRGGDGKTLSTRIRPLPSPPQYFKARSDTVWNLDFNDSNQITMPEYDDTHILIQRAERLPLSFFAYPATFSPALSAILASEEDAAGKYKRIREYFRPIVENKPNAEVTTVYRVLADQLESVISTAVKKLSWNWRAVVPCFNPERNEPCFLLPVSFSGEGEADRAMIAGASEIEGERIYTIHTVIPLHWAYLDARLVCRPESEWLAADFIGKEE